MQEPPAPGSCNVGGLPRDIDPVGFRRLRQKLADAYDHGLRPPVTIILLLMIFCGLAVPYAPQFAFDASTDTLIAEQDPELAYYERVVETFGEASFLDLTYTPVDGPLLVPHHTEQLQALERDLLGVPGVAGVTSILDAPLLRSPPIPLTTLGTDYKTLRDVAVDLRLAEQELTTSPLFKELLWVCPALSQRSALACLLAWRCCWPCWRILPCCPACSSSSTTNAYPWRSTR